MTTNKKRTSGILKKRFRLYDPHGDYSKPEVVSLVNNETDYEYGTPSLSRNENVTLVASNANKDVLFVKLKWRPEEERVQKVEATGLVCLSTEFKLKVGDRFYQHDELLAYAPVDSATRPGRITQYGSKKSSLKMLIQAPFRRIRLVFNGFMSEPASSRKLFVKARFVVSPTSGIFDCLTDLASAQLDRHMQMVRVLGECTIDSKTESICVFGFHVRDFLDESMLSSNSKSIIGSSVNGQSFHVAQLKGSELACACYDLHNSLKEAEKLPEIDWVNINSETDSFKFELKAQTMSATCVASKIPGLPDNFYDIKFNGKKGWALIEIDGTRDSLSEEKARQAKLEEYYSGLRAGKIRDLGLPSSTQATCIVEIDDASCRQRGLVGSKGASLAQLRAISSTNNFRVSRAIVLTRHAHDLILRENEEIADLTSNLEASVGSGSSLDELRQEIQALQKVIRGTELPRSLRSELELHLSKSEHYKQSGAYAVRSSSWGEDEQDMSAAGQLETVLGVQGIDAISRAVMQCLASKFSVENVEYKRQHGLQLSLPMAVIVHEMVQCDRAGVMFTCNPTSGNQWQLTITANYGLGESIVSGQADPDTILVDVDAQDALTVSKIDIGRKKIVAGASSSQCDRSKCCLDDGEILELARCGRALAHYFQGPQDIEWGYKDDCLFLFQSRPVTGLDSCTEFEILHEADMPTAAEVEFITRANMGEVMPAPLTPLTLSFPHCLSRITVRRLFQNLGVPLELSEHSTSLVCNSYHIFMTLRDSVFFELAESGGDKPVVARVMEIGLFGRELGEQTEIMEASSGYPKRKNPFGQLAYIWYTSSLILRPIRTLMKSKDRIKATRDKIRKEVLKAQTLPTEERLLKLFDLLMSLSKHNVTTWENHFNIVMLTNFANTGLMTILAKYIRDPVQIFASMANFFLIKRGVISAEIPVQIRKMAEIISKKGEEEKFVNLTTEEAVDYIRRDKKLDKKFRKFLKSFGHRSYNEMELASKSWRENHAAVIDMLKTNCRTSGAVLANEEAATPLKRVIDSLELDGLTTKDRFILERVVGPRCRLYVAARERSKDLLIENIDLKRETSRALAKELQSALRIPDQDLLFYFFLDELQQLVRAPCPSLVVQATRRRNTFKKLFKDLWLFDEIIPGPYFTPNHLRPSRELDESLRKAPQLHGSPASSGRVQAKVCLIKSFAELNKVRAGDILVTHSTDIAFSPVFPLIAGIITEVGGLISHGAVVAREYGLPSLLGIPDVTRILQDGEEIVLDADNGTIFRLNEASANEQC